MADSLSQLTASTAALTIGPKPAKEDQGVIEWQNKEIKWLKGLVKEKENDGRKRGREQL